MFQVFYKYSACIKICTDQIRILCDPWFGDDAYDGTWTQFPYIDDVANYVGDFDAIYISHIHPDHYCFKSLDLLFSRYGKKQIFIADWGKEKSNFLERKLISDGLGELVLKKNSQTIGDTQINIIPNVTESNSDIDSALIVSSISSGKSVLNINDCIYNKSHFEEIMKIKNKLVLTLFCLGYTGAGPYPQTYYSPITQKELLIKKSFSKKKQFFDRYKLSTTKIPSKVRLPFAGKYLLQGQLSILNKYRGVADPLEVKNIDDNAIVLDDGGDAYFDIEKLYASRERKEFYKYPEIIKAKDDYKWRTCISFIPDNNLLKRLLIQAIKKAHLKSQCNFDCCYSIYPYPNPEELNEIWSTSKPQDFRKPIITFNCNKDANPFNQISKKIIHSHIFIESKALFAVLTGISHWNNYEVGSAFQVRRFPDELNKEMQAYLNFLSVI